MSEQANMHFLCTINPKAGADEEVLKEVKAVFGADTHAHLLEELSDIYIVCPASEDTLDKLSKLQANKGVLDTSIEVVRTRHLVQKEVKTDNVFLVLADTENGAVNTFIDGLQAEVGKRNAGEIELLFVGEIFSPRADVAAIISTNGITLGEVSGRIRELSGVKDTQVYTFKRVFLGGA